MQSLSAFFDITKVADFPRKNADVTRIQVDESSDLYIFWIFFKQGVTVSSLVTIGTVILHI